MDYPGSVLAPCADLKSKMLILNGVGNYVAARDLLGGIEGHECRSVTFTGMANNLPGEPNKARGPSIDQLIISHLGETRPLHASIGGYGGTGSEYYYNGLGNAIPGVYTPRGIFDALFADVPSSGAPTDASAVALRNYARALLTRQLADAQTLKGRVGSEGKAKLEEYLATIQDRIRALETVPTGQIAVPARPTVDPDYGKALAPTGSLGVTHVACLRLDHSVFETYYLGRTIATYDTAGNATGSRVISDTHQHVSHAPIWGDHYRDLAQTSCYGIFSADMPH
jgi:hypothetical protein